MNWNRSILILLILIGVTSGVQAQITVSGKLVDSTDNSALVGANIVLYPVNDSTNWKGTITGLDGDFVLDNIVPGTYHLRMSFIGYDTKDYRNLKLTKSIDFATVKMRVSATMLDAVGVEDVQVRVEQKGDTTQYNAGAFKTNPDANTEDLVTKMPGVTSENGTLKVNGEEVKRILVDGKPFFGDDPNMALKNLPADVIDKIQVFDQQSDQAQFTGYNDGSGVKTMNIVTKSSVTNGIFGKVYAGYGENDYYQAGGSVNFFNGDRKLSVLGMSNNINVQNFSSDDLGGVASSSGSSGGGSPMRGRGGGPGGSDPTSNFLVGNQNGIAKTHAFGLNYTDVWKKNTKVTASYFFNNGDRDKNSSLLRDFILQDDSVYQYSESSRSNYFSYGHRANFKFEITIDTMNSVTLNGKFNYGTNKSVSTFLGQNSFGVNILETSTQNDNGSNSNSLSYGGNLLLKHKFRKNGRTISIDLIGDYNNRYGDAYLTTLSHYYYSSDSIISLNQQSDNSSGGYSFSSNVSYTEQLGKKGQLQINYIPSISFSNSEKNTYNFETVTNDFSQIDTSLTNLYDNVYATHKAGLSYRYNFGKWNINFGANYQYATLKGRQDFPFAAEVDKSFNNILPNAIAQIKFSKNASVRINYRTSTSAPSISQLQEVIDNSNTLFLKTGNPDLKQSVSHNIFGRYSIMNPDKARSLFIMFGGGVVQDYIANSTFIASSDTLLSSGVQLNRGSQLSKPVNMKGNKSFRTFINYAFPIKKLKSNFNINTGFTFNGIPSYVNEAINISNNYVLSQGVSFTSNISEKLDFNLSYNGSYTMVRNSIQSQSNNDYFLHTASFKFNWLPWKGLVINSVIAQTLYAGLSSDYNIQYTLWNAAIGYKFLKNKSLEIKVSAYDLLNQNNSISRSITPIYIEDSQSNVINRYFMIIATYTIKKINQEKKTGPRKVPTL